MLKESNNDSMNFDKKKFNDKNKNINEQKIGYITRERR